MNLYKSKCNSTSNSNSNKVAENNHLCDLWKHTIAQVFKHDPKSELGLMLREWIIFSKLENFNSILNYTIDDFTPSGNFSYINDHGDVLHQSRMHEVFNLRWYIQHLMDENEDEAENPLSHENRVKQTNWKFIKYVIHHKHSMTPEQLKQKHCLKKFSRLNMKNLIHRKGSQMKRKSNTKHPQKSQNKILSLTDLLKMKKSKK